MWIDAAVEEDDDKIKGKNHSESMRRRQDQILVRLPMHKEAR